jgi:hypothetical protein
MPNCATHRIPLTAEEIELRIRALKQSVAFRHDPSTSKDDFELQIMLWQAALAREVKTGSGIDALCQILSVIKNQYADDQIKLLSAIDKIRDCADRHLTVHDDATIDAIFLGVFIDEDDALGRFGRTSIDTRSNDFHRAHGTPRTTIEAIMWTVRTRGLSALNEPANIERLSRCDTAAQTEINERIGRLIAEKKVAA